MATKKSKKELLDKPPVVESKIEISQYEIDWAKIAHQVQEAAEMVKANKVDEVIEKPKKVTKKKKSA